jgi:hypothetical protein
MPLARFWAMALEYQIRPFSEATLQRMRERGITDLEDVDSVCIESPDEGSSGTLPNVWFEQVPEGKVVKNRIHLDVNLHSRDELDRFVELGARVLHPFGSIPDSPWAILADPEGNEFCVDPPE